MAVLSDAVKNMMIGIPANRTRTINYGGPDAQQACRNWALTGGTAPDGGQWVCNLFGLINIGLGDNPVARAVQIEQNNGQMPDPGEQMVYDDASQDLLAAGMAKDKKWGDRQRTKRGKGGKYTTYYMTEKVVRRAVERSGLKIATGKNALNDANYVLCMHWDQAVGVGEEHWWIEAYAGGNWYTIEIVPGFAAQYIYTPRLADRANFSRVEVPLKELLPAHVNQIANIMQNGQTIATRFNPGVGYGWSN
jgi:hypothetical protein